MIRKPKVFDEQVLFSPSGKRKDATELVEITEMYPRSALPTQWTVTVRVLRDGRILKVMDCCLFRQRESGRFVEKD